MTRSTIDCRQFPQLGCTVAIAADSESELLDAAVAHNVSVHKGKDTPELRAQLRQLVKREPAAQVSA